MDNIFFFICFNFEDCDFFFKIKLVNIEGVLFVFFKWFLVFMVVSYYIRSVNLWVRVYGFLIVFMKEVIVRNLF